MIGDFAAAIATSDAAIDEVVDARADKTGHVAAGQDAEVDWVDAMVRLRRYVASRAKRTETAKIEEGRALLAPLLDAMKKLNAEAAARATKKKAQGSSKGAPATTGTTATPAPTPTPTTGTSSTP